jgi:hypothetical protein
MPADFPFDALDPLARSKGETVRANLALKDYYYLGAGRSFAKLIDAYQGSQKVAGSSQNTPPTSSLKQLAKWSMLHAWQARVQAQADLDDEADKAEWEARRRQVRDADWRQGAALRSLAEQVLQEGPNFIKTRRRIVKGSPQVLDAKGNIISLGQPDREIVTMALDGYLAVRASRAGSQLTRLAAGMETNRQGISLSGSLGGKPETDYGNFDADQIKRQLADQGRLLLALASGTNLTEQPGITPGGDPEGESSKPPDA